MRTSAILNLKGGVAKTSTAVNVAAILASDYKQRVLLVDADSQCNTTEFFGGDPEIGSLADVLRWQGDNIAQYARDRIQTTKLANLDLLAGDDSLMDLDLTKVETQSVQATCLRDMIHLLEQQDRYDFCLVDCPPAFNAASAAALTAADDVIIPIKLDAFSLRGMTNLLRQIYNMQQINPKLRVAGCMPTMWYKSPKLQEAEATLRASSLPVYQTRIRRTDKVDDMTFEQEPLRTYSPRSAAAVDYRRFVREYLAQGGVSNG
ncbi:MAG: ParA family protein [Elusimicrobiales bacterium]|nr:ParA family protein [Elusimicrobiales bacterium]